jgi:hypothetical protein
MKLGYLSLHLGQHRLRGLTDECHLPDWGPEPVTERMPSRDWGASCLAAGFRPLDACRYEATSSGTSKPAALASSGAATDDERRDSQDAESPPCWLP